jgi:hypothetical protein
LPILSVAELVQASCEEAPGPPELVEVVTSVAVEGVDLARRALLRGDLLDVDESALLDAHEDGVHRPLGDVGEPLLAQAGGDLVPVGRSLAEDRQDDPLQGALEQLGQLLAHVVSCYSVSLTTSR